MTAPAAPPCPPRAVGTAAVAVLLLLYLGLLATHSLQTRRFSPDSMNYLSVAREIAAGHGLVQPALGFNQFVFAPDAPIPTPFTAQAPGYPLAIAGLSWLGPSAEHSALLLALGGFAAILALGFTLARTHFGPSAGWLCLTLLLLQSPLRLLGSVAWSETLGIALVLFALHLLGRRQPLLAGLAAGLAAGVRYALLPAGLAAGLGWIAWTTSGRARLRAGLGFVTGFALPVGLMLGRNYLILGTLLPQSAASDVGLDENLYAALRSLAGAQLGGIFGSTLEMVLLGSLLAVSIFRAVRISDPADEAGGAAVRRALWLWPAAYVLFVVIQRTFSHFDEIGDRLIAPAAVGFALPLSSLLATAWPRLVRWAPLCALLVLLPALGRQSALLAQGKPPQARLSRQGLLRQHTTPRDLIVGDDTVGIAYWARRPTVSFSTYPYSERPTYEFVRALARQQSSRFDRVFLLLERDPKTPELWNLAFGEFFADLVAGRAARYPGVVPVAENEEGWIFRLEPAP